MSDFSITAAAECNTCGQLLSTSDEDCTVCSEDEVYEQMFRRIVSKDGPDVIGVRATMDFKWEKLKREVGDDWIGYEWLGPKESVIALTDMPAWDSIEEVPRREMSTRAPKDL